MKLNPERLQVAYDLLREHVASGTLPVGLLAVADRREVLRCEGYGPSGPIDPAGIYLLASITKPIVATAVMQLVERGKLLVDDPVARHIPEYAVNDKGKVKVWHLLTHTSGMDEGYTARLGSRTPEADLRGACETFLRFAPGSRYEYCNAAFRVLGELVTRLGGQPYPDYLREHVFEPAGMVDTAFWPEPAKRQRVLPVADFPDDLVSVEAFAAAAHPAGGLFSTAADLVAFGQAYLNGGRGRHGRLLGPATIATMTCLHTAGIADNATGEPAWRGLGWSKVSPRQGLLLAPAGYGHGGATGTHLWIDPENELVLVFLTNRWGLDSGVKQRILNAVMAAIE